MPPLHPTERGYPKLVQLIALELADYPNRIARAHETMNDARSPLKANSYEATATGTTTGPNPAATNIAARATRQRKELDRTINLLDQLTRTIRTILNEWAPTPTTPLNNLWCQNCLKHGHHNPRNPDGSTNCRWCNDVQRNYGQLPGRKLIDLHTRGRRITEPEYKRLLGKSA